MNKTTGPNGTQPAASRVSKRVDSRIVAALEQIDGVRVAPYKDTDLISVFAHDKEVGHFHADGSLDLRLTKRVIASEGLTHPNNSTQHPRRSPNSPWIELPCHLDQTEELVRLVELAIAQR